MKYSMDIMGEKSSPASAIDVIGQRIRHHASKRESANRSSSWLFFIGGLAVADEVLEKVTGVKIGTGPDSVGAYLQSMSGVGCLIAGALEQRGASYHGKMSVALNQTLTQHELAMDNALLQTETSDGDIVSEKHPQHA